MHNRFAIYSDTRPMDASEALKVGRHINRLARAHRRSWQSTSAAQVRTGVALFVAIAEAGVSRRLNTLGELLDAHGIDNEVSERTLDSPFESGAVTDMIVAKLTRKVANDQGLRVALSRQGWGETVKRWLVEAASHPGQAGERAKRALEAIT